MQEPVKPVEAVIDSRLSAAELLERYQLGSRSALTNRMQALGISAYKDGKVFYVPIEAVEQLDKLHECLKLSGAKLDECVQQVTTQMQSNGISFASTKLGPTSQPLPILFPDNLTVRLLPEDVVLVELIQRPDPLEQAEKSRRILHACARRGDVLPTSQLLPLLGLRSLPGLQDGKWFARRGFVFIKMPRNGRETEWRITKV